MALRKTMMATANCQLIRGLGQWELTEMENSQALATKIQAGFTRGARELASRRACKGEATITTEVLASSSNKSTPSRKSSQLHMAKSTIPRMMLRATLSNRAAKKPRAWLIHSASYSSASPLPLCANSSACAEASRCSELLQAFR